MGSRQSENLVYHGTEVKIYPDGQQKVMVCSKPIFKSECREQVDEFEKEKAPVPKPKDMSNEVCGGSLKRAKEACSDIACCNDFRWLTTRTLDQQKIGHCDPKEVGQKLRKFLNNKVGRSDAWYIATPECHADGKGIHMHGLLAGDFDMVDSRKETPEGKTIYNMSQRKHGWSTAIELDGSKVVVMKYITKCVTKDFRKIFSSLHHAGDKGPIRKPSIQLLDIDFEAAKVDKIFKPSEWNVKYRYVDINEQATKNTAAILKVTGEAEYVYG